MKNFVVFHDWKEQGPKPPAPIYIDPIEVVAVLQGKGSFPTYLMTRIELRGGAKIYVPGDPDEIMEVLAGHRTEHSDGTPVQHISIGDVEHLTINGPEAA